MEWIQDHLKIVALGTGFLFGLLFILLGRMFKDETDPDAKKMTKMFQPIGILLIFFVLLATITYLLE